MLNQEFINEIKTEVSKLFNKLGSAHINAPLDSLINAFNDLCDENDDVLDNNNTTIEILNKSDTSCFSDGTYDIHNYITIRNNKTTFDTTHITVYYAPNKYSFVYNEITKFIHNNNNEVILSEIHNNSGNIVDTEPYMFLYEHYNFDGENYDNEYVILIYVPDDTIYDLAEYEYEE